MMIQEKVLEQALAQVFDGKSAGEKLPLAEISTVWNTLGLRNSDMRDAIREMIECHCLETQSHHGGLEFVLTRRGEQRFNSCLHHDAGLNTSDEAWGQYAPQH